MPYKPLASGVKMIGVSSAIKEADIVHLTDPEQDDLIHREAQRLEGELREFVGKAVPRGDLVFQVRGPEDDPIQGRIWIHTIAGPFALDDLPNACGAYKAHHGVTDTPTQIPVEDENQ